MPQAKNMVIFDANMILRYLLNDNAAMAEKAEMYLHQGTVTVTTEVIAEVVYVLKSVYHMSRNKIAETLESFMQIVQCREKKAVEIALETYGRENLDFVDCILYGYHRVDNVEVATFDKKLLNLLHR